MDKWEQLRCDMTTDATCGHRHAKRVLLLMEEYDAACAKEVPAARNTQQAQPAIPALALMNVTRLREDILARWVSANVKFVGVNTPSLAVTLALEVVINAAKSEEVPPNGSTNSESAPRCSCGAVLPVKCAACQSSESFQRAQGSL